jgi:hypothetical protein
MGLATGWKLSGAGCWSNRKENQRGLGRRIPALPRLESRVYAVRMNTNTVAA